MTALTRATTAVTAVLAITLSTTAAIAGPLTLPSGADTPRPLLIDVGASAPTTVNGWTWTPDTYYVGGAATDRGLVTSTDVPSVMSSTRYGMAAHHIPVPAGTYEVSILMAETFFDAPGKRVFDVAAEDRTVLEDVDPFALAKAAFRATERTFVTTVTDGELTIDYTAVVEHPSVSAITIVPVEKPAAATTPALHIDTGSRTASTSSGVEWLKDSHAVGGSTSLRPSVSGTQSSGVYSSIRYGMSAYRVPVKNGTYDVRLRMAETYFSSSGQRVFGATVEGRAALTDFDIFTTAGGKGKAVDRVVRTTVTDGRLDIDFTRKVNYPSVSAISIVPVAAAPAPSPAPPAVAPPVVKPTPTPTPRPTAVPTAAPTTPRPSTTPSASPSSTPSPSTTPSASPTRTSSPSPTTTAPRPGPSPTPSATNTPSAPAPSSGPPPPGSSWVAPTLVNPIVWTPSAEERRLKAPADRDVLVVWPDKPLDVVGGFEINGGRNVVSKGGEIRFSKKHFPTATTAFTDNRCLYITGGSDAQAQRTVHVEGLHCAGDYVWEGINIDSKGETRNLTVQLRDITVDGVNADLTGKLGEHFGGDALQAWNGPHRLRVDGFRAYNLHYQGFFLQPNQFGSGGMAAWDLNDIYLEGDSSGSNYLLWLAGDRGTGSGDIDLSVRNFWLKPSPGASLDKTIWDRTNDWSDVQIGTHPNP